MKRRRDRAEPLADDLAVARDLADLLLDEISPCSSAATPRPLHEGGDARAGILHQVLDRLAERGMALQPTQPPAGHRPVLGEGLDEQDAVLLVHDVVERGRQRVRPAVNEASVDFVGDDPEPVLAREVEDEAELLPRRRPARRVGGRVDE